MSSVEVLFLRANNVTHNLFLLRYELITFRRWSEVPEAGRKYSTSRRTCKTKSIVGASSFCGLGLVAFRDLDLSVGQALPFKNQDIRIIVESLLRTVSDPAERQDLFRSVEDSRNETSSLRSLKLDACATILIIHSLQITRP